MEFLFTIIGTEYIQSMLSPDLLAKVTYTVVILGFAWAKHRRDVKKFMNEVTLEVKTFMTEARDEVSGHVKTMDNHFKEMENIVDKKLGEVVKELANVKTVVKEDLNRTAHEIKEIKIRLEKVETNHKEH